MRLCVEYVGEHVHYPGPATACSYIVSSNYQLPTFYAGGGGVLRLPTTTSSHLKFHCLSPSLLSLSTCCTDAASLHNGNLGSQH